MGSLFYKEFMAEQIIWSADLDWPSLREVIDSRILPPGTVIKLDRLFFEKNPKEIITYIQDAGYYVFVDAKIIEIPDKVIAITEIYLEYRPWMINIMAGACSTGKVTADNPKHVDTMKRFADDCAKVGTKSCAVTVLTSKSEEMCCKEFYFDSETQVLKYVDLMTECGLTDIVCSPKEAAAIRKNMKYDGLCINTPGVRLADTSADDQQRIMTPYLALENGSDRLVIGRNLTEGEGEIVDRIRRNYYERIIVDIRGEDY